LKSAARLGFFRDPASREYARRDPDFAILANLDEFRRVINEDFTRPSSCAQRAWSRKADLATGKK
jgi:hypothetical protein